MPKCLHCPRRALYGKRGLCYRCYRTPEIRSRYPANQGGHEPNDETAEQLEAIITNQRERLPEWWDERRPK